MSVLIGITLTPLPVFGIATLSYVQQTIRVESHSYDVRIPDGYRLEFLTGDLEGARMITFGPRNEILVGSKAGRVYRLFPPYVRSEVLLGLDDYPHSVAWRDGMLYIARTSGLYRIAYDERTQWLDSDEVQLVARVPGGLGHSSRSVGVGPEGRIYLSLGISGNCSDEYLGPGYRFEDRRGGVMTLDETVEPPEWRTFASGLRNPIGFDWHPRSGILYASNNGPDHLGFDQPPEYFSKLTENSFHGMPWFQYDGRTIKRDPCIKSTPPLPQASVEPPAALLPSRNAPMGVAFVPPSAMDPRMAENAVVALHGSWGTRPLGSAFGNPASRRQPKLVLVRFESGTPERVDDLVTGFQLEDGRRWARPTGVAFGPDGALYFTSDDETQGLFRLRRIP